MRAFTLIGKDETTGARVSMSVQLGSVGEAVDFGCSRGIDVQEVRSEAGHVYRVTPDGLVKGDPKPEDQRDRAEVALFLVCAAIPLVGFVAGSVRIGTKRSGGLVLIGAAVVGVILWGVLLVSASGS